MPENFDELPERLDDELEQRLDRFDDAWADGPPPDIHEFLPPAVRAKQIPAEPRWRRFVAELLSIDLEHRLRRSADQPPRIEDYFTAVPWVSSDPHVLCELIHGEYLQRCRRGETVHEKEYHRRFPRLAAAVTRALADARAELDRERPSATADDEAFDAAATEDFGIVRDETLVQRRPVGPTPNGTDGMPERLGDYELQHEIARGGMGIVYKATQRSLKRPVALKVIRAGGFADAQDIRRFHAEAEAAAQLDHPHIVPIFDVGQEQGHPYFSMAWIDGPSLSAVVAQQPLAPERAAKLMRDVAAAIHYAHSRGIIHRDLKPSNILLEGDLTPRVTDFGLARQTSVESGVTERGQVLGAPPYMPPEQALGHIEKVDRRSDVYSLGATLYHLLTGRPPFLAATVLQTLAQVVQDEPVSPRRLNDNIPRDLENICLKCLGKSPDDRYQTADEFGQDLDRFLRGVPTLARPISLWERAYRFCRRKPRVAALLAMVVGSVLLALLAISTSLVWTRQSLRETRIAETKTRAALNRVEDSEARARASAADAIAQKDLAQQHLRIAEFHIYLNELQRARQLWSEGQIDEVRTVLNGLPRLLTLWDELRGWEYDYTRGLLQQELWKFDPAHQGRIATLAWSRDGDRIASAGQDRIVKIWDAGHRRLHEACRGHSGWVGAVGFVDDGTRLLSLGEDGTARLWDERRSWLPEVVANDLNGLKVAAVSPSGHRWAWSDGRRVEVRALGNDEPLLQQQNESADVTALQFDADETRLALADAAHQTITVRALSGPAPAVEFAGVEGRCFALAFSPDGRHLAAGGTSGWLQVWDLDAQRLLGRWSEAQGTIYAMQFSADGNQLLTSTADGTVRLWSIARQQTLETFRGHADGVFAARLQPGGEQILSAGADGTLRLWRSERNQIHLEGLTGSGRAVPDRAGRGLRYLKGQTLRSMSFNPGVPPTEVPLALAAVSHLLPLPFPPGSFVVAHGDGLLHCDAEGRALHPYGVGRSPARKVCTSPSGEQMALCDEAGGVRLFAVADQEPLWQRDFEAQAAALAYLSDGTRLIVVDVFGTATWLDAATGAIVSSGSLSDGIHCLAIAPQAPLLAVGEIDGTIRLHHQDDLRELLVLRAHQQSVNDLAFSADGRRLASAGSDGAVRIWSPQHPAPLLMLEGHHHPVLSVDWSEDGDSLITVDQSGIAIRWGGRPAGFR